ncbi:hypothetical protein N24_3094 [Corynebacterium suranareeae]|uniref:Uncharacterized protein n=1 Tax=Corynebacterium suranareeae TaxID=2506452 RepID=A0A169SAT3_9CORY|nr:YdcF family protein [Corynebacterium suranareeae]BAU97356.1 hypothetical protein N24_3094 [Corynebacterium suranareeae]
MVLKIRHLLLKRFIPLLLSVMVICGLVLAWFVFPSKAEPKKVDVVLVIAGASDGRHEYGAQLVEDGYASNYVVSNPSGSRDKVGYAHCAGNKRPEGATSYCMDPYPVITSGEARTFNDLAKEHGWESALVVTSRTHTQRVRTMFDQCYTGESTVLNVNSLGRTGLYNAVLHEIGGYIKFWITAPCADIS